MVIPISSIYAQYSIVPLAGHIQHLYSDMISDSNVHFILNRSFQLYPPPHLLLHPH